MTKVLAISNKQLQLENVRFMFRPNFEGRKTEFNALGDRNFQIVIDPEDIPVLQDYGINVKLHDPAAKNPDLDPDVVQPTYYIKVKVYTEYSTPVIALINDDGELDVNEEVPTDNITFLTPDMYGMIDEMEIRACDMVIRRREKHERGTYARLDLSKAYIHVQSTPLARKYGF